MTDTAPQPLPEMPAKAKPKTSETGEFLKFVVKLLLFVFVLRSFIFQPVSIPSESMLPRLLVGDYLIVSKWPYGFSTYSLWLPKGFRELIGERPRFSTDDDNKGRVLGNLPRRGDVVVFKAPPGNETDYIKRVIGLPGDTVQMRDGVLFLNGAEVKKERIGAFVVPVSPNTQCARADLEETASDGTRRCRYPRFRETLPGGRSYEVLDLDNSQMDTTDVYTVPENHMFCMGDNRDRSADSRFPAIEGAGIGIVPVANLVGRASFTVFSTDGSASWLLPWTWFSAARWDRIGEGF